MQAPRRLQLRRGNTAAVSAYLGAPGELIVNTDTNTLYLHDGVTIGGIATTVNTASITSNISAITNGSAVFGNLIPAANVTYSLGNVTHQWNDLYVSNNTIYVGGVPLSIDNTGNLTINGNVIPTIGYVNTAVANVTVDLTSYALNANVTAANVGLKGYVDQANTIQSGQLTQANLGLKGYVDQQISNLIGSAPGILDTLGEIANSINDDANVYASLVTSINNSNVGLKGYVDQANTIQSQQLVSANVGIIGYIDQGNSIQSGQLAQANIGMKGYVDNAVSSIVIPVTYSNVNVAAYLTTEGYAKTSDITTANVGIIGYINQGNTIQSAAITAANVGLKGYVDQANTIMKAYVDGQISAANTNVSSSGTNYSNVNVKAYTESMGFKNYSNVNVAVYLGNVSHNINPVPNDIWGLGAENKEWYSAHIKNAYIKETIQAYSGGGYSGGNSGELLKSTGSGIAWQEIKTVNGNSLFGNGDISISGGGSSYGNSNVAVYLPTYSGNIANITLGPSGALTFADGTTQITAGGGSYSNIQVATYLPTYAGTVGASLVNTAGNILTTGLSVFGNTRIGLAGAVSGQFHSVVGNITQTSSGGAVYINTTGNVLAAAVVAGAVTSTGTVAVNAATGITTNQTTFLLANATATTINMGGAATTIRMGTNTSNVWVGRALGNQNRELLIRAQGTWNTAINIDSNGGFNSPPYANQAVIGGSGTGMTANYSATGGYLTTLTIYNPGTGYQNGDVISVPGGIAGNSFTLTNYSSTLTGNSAAAYTFGIEGNLTVPGNVAARNFIGTVATASQTNITQVGTLGTLTVSGNATVGNLVGTESNTRIIANTYVTTFDIYGNVSFPGNITVSSLGITMPTRPAFRVNGSVGPTQTTGNVNLKSPQAVALFNQGNYYDGTTGKFTAPVAGIYSVGVSARVADNSSSQIAVLKNGLNTAGNVACFWESDTNAGTAIHFGVNGTIQMAVGDYLSANILLGNINFDQNDNWHVTYLG